jgi:exopolyphosphatase/guanosine-5'-triphosphate,3'-diphosphate pyrophosphatase
VEALSQIKPEEGGSARPVRVAAIDVGSNAIRYLIAEGGPGGGYHELESDRLPVRLGREVFTKERRLSAETMQAGVAALAGIRARLDALGVGSYRAVATSAVRESRNGEEFVERVRKESGIRLERISGADEAWLLWKAVANRIPFGRGRWLLVDVGGGSVEVSVADQDGILWSESHTLGAVRLLQGFSEGGAPKGNYRDLLERYVQVLKIPAAVAEWRPMGVIATGGNSEALARLARAPVDAAGIAILHVEDLGSVLSRVADLTIEERMSELGLRVDRADVILPAGVVYERVAELAGATELLVPAVGLREGLLLDLLGDVHDHRAHAAQRERELRAAAVALGRRCLFDEAHARQVAALALSLFDQLATLHGMGGAERRILLAASLLHDIGQFVSYRRHHKHSWYLISNSDLPELSPDETRVVALVARYHRRTGPNRTHDDFVALRPEEQAVVRKLAPMVRIADSLDRGHAARVRGLTVRVQDDAVWLDLDAREDLDLEEWALESKRQLFEGVYGRPLRVQRTQ